VLTGTVRVSRAHAGRWRAAMAGSRQVWDFTGLRAMFLNGTLKGSAEVPSTEGLIEVSASLMRRHGVEVEVLQAIAHDTDNAADPGCGDRFGDHSERDMPTARPLAGDAIRLPICKSVAAFELYPADLRPPAHWTVPGCRGGPEQPAARRSAGPHPGRLYATSGADGSRRRGSATPGQGHATPAAERSTTRRQATAPQPWPPSAARPGR
jgi:hypothetical protein